MSKVPNLVIALRSLHLSNTQRLPRGKWAYFNKHKKVTDPARQDPDYFEKEAAKLPLDDHYLDALKHLWEEKIGSERELNMKASDRLIGQTQYFLPDVDQSQPRLPYENLDALREAPDAVKKIFSIEYGQRKDLTAAWKRDMIQSVNRHKYDNESLQMRIAWTTALIRHYTQLLDEERLRGPKRPKWLKHKIYLVIAYRRKLLRLLREQDLPEFEKVLETLKISMIMPKPPEHVKTRKAWSEFQLKRRVEEEKEKRLHKLHVEQMKNRDQRAAEIEQRLAQLDEEERNIYSRLAEIDALEGKVSNVAGTYQPKLVEELSEAVMHSQYFYHPKPSMSAT
ncbi:Protein MRPS-15 [Aphelenchoides avenae]|nr:Protein MRPS-15 [Aphelenchus avenae]